MAQNIDNEQDVKMYLLNKLYVGAVICFFFTNLNNNENRRRSN